MLRILLKTTVVMAIFGLSAFLLYLCIAAEICMLVGAIAY